MNKLQHTPSSTSLLLGLLLTLVLLGGCASHLPQQLLPITVTQAQEAAAWEVQGKLAVRTADEKFSTNLYWLHTPTTDELKLTTMLGTTVLSLTHEKGQSVLVVDGKTYKDSEPQRLLRRVTGWSIPLSALPFWITGQLSPNDTLLLSDKQLRPQKIINTRNQANWHVIFNRWQSQSGAEVPRLLSVTRDGLRLKLQVSQWQALGQAATQITNSTTINKE